MDELKKVLTAISNEDCRYDDPEFIANDWFGGNMDDAYNGGVEDGRVELAREILQKFKTLFSS